MNTRTVPGACAAAAWLLLAAMVSAASNQSSIPVSLERLGPVPTGETSVTFSPDGAHVAWAARQGNRWVVRVDGRTGPRYDDILEILPVAEPSTANIVLRDVLEPTAEDTGTRPRSLLFSPDGARLAYVAQRGREQVVVVDGRPGAGFSRIVACGFSPDGSRFGYIAENTRREVQVVIDGNTGPAFTTIERFVFSPDGSRCAYVGTTRDSRNRVQYTLVVDDDTIERNVRERVSAPTFDTDGNRFAYVKETGRGRTHVVVDGRVGPSHAAVVASSLRFSDDGHHFAYFAHPTTSSKSVELILDGRRTETFDQVMLEAPDTVRFAPDGTLVFLAIRNNAYVRASCATDPGGTYAANPVPEGPPAADVKPNPPGTSSAPPTPAPATTADDPIGEIEHTADQVGQALDAIGNLFGGDGKKKKN